MLIRKKWLISALLFILIVSLNSWSDCFCFGYKFSDKGDLKVLSFNVNGRGDSDVGKGQSIISCFEIEAPDIIFLTEFYKPITDSLSDWLHDHYPYDTKTRSLPHNVIYSRYPLNCTQYHKKIGNGSSFIVQCNTVVKGEVISLFGCHLSSNNYSGELDYLTPGKVETFSDLKAYMANISEASIQRKMEADSIVRICSKSERVIIMGDLNDVCGAPSLRVFQKAGLKDAWSVGGMGYGSTIHHPLPYRIDHIMFNQGMKLKGIKRIGTHKISDHDALVAVFDL